MDRNIAMKRAWAADSWNVGEEPSPSSRSEWAAAFWLSKGETLILVLLLSFGLWAAIWGALILLAAGGPW
jgi:hypothetical protein